MQCLQDLRGKEASLGFLGLPLGVPCPKVFLVGDSLHRGSSADHRVIPCCERVRASAPDRCSPPESPADLENQFGDGGGVVIGLSCP
jgi:hypothetical protein